MPLSLPVMPVGEPTAPERVGGRSAETLGGQKVSRLAFPPACGDRGLNEPLLRGRFLVPDVPFDWLGAGPERRGPGCRR